MDIPKQIIVIVFAQGILVILFIIGYGRRSRRDGAIAAQSPSDSTAETVAGGPSWVWVACAMAGFAALLVLWRPCSTWYWSRHPPTIEHRSELIEAAWHQLRCPAEQLTIERFGDTGAKVTGCGGTTQLCWRQTSRNSRPSWLGCYQPD